VELEVVTVVIPSKLLRAPSLPCDPDLPALCSAPIHHHCLPCPPRARLKQTRGGETDGDGHGVADVIAKRTVVGRFRLKEFE